MNKLIYDILEKLNKNGYKAYLVGGSVRDYLLKREVHDIDITTSRRPDEIKEVFSSYKMVEVGKKFGTIKLVIDKEEIEITTFRKEGDYDGRKPHYVVFSDFLSDDLKRRDFTINQFTMDKEGNIGDEYNGKKDLEDRIIRAINDPYERINEDYLRIMRAIRFSGQLNFEIEDNLKKAIIQSRFSLSKISSERINDEFSKILLSDYPKKSLNLLMDLGIIEVILKEFKPMKGFNQKTPFHHLDLWDHTLEVVNNCPKDLELRLAGFFHDLAKLYTQEVDENGLAHYYNHARLSAEMSSKILKRFKYPNSIIDNVYKIINMHMDSMNIYTKKRLKRLLSKYGEDLVRKFFQFYRADTSALNKDIASSFTNIDKGEELLNEILQNEEAFNRKSLKIDGNDLIDLGFKEGKDIGKILSDLMDKVISEDIDNDRSQLISYVQGRYKDG